MPMQSPTLRDMIQDAIGRGASLRDLQDRAIDPVTGERAGKDTIAKIRRGEMNRMPMEHHLRGIAAALEQPYEVVRQAAIAEWIPGEPAAEDEERQRQIAELRRLRDEADAALAHLERPGRRAG